MHHTTRIEVYEAKLAEEPRAAGLTDQVPRDVWRKKFVVDIAAVEVGRSTVACLAPYVHRLAIGNHRIVEVTETSVTYRYKPKKSKTLRERPVPGETIVCGFAQHILPRGFRKVRYFG